MANDLGVQFDIESILSDLASLMTAESKEDTIRETLYKISFQLEKFLDKFNAAYENLKTSIDLSNKMKALRKIHKMQSNKVIPYEENTEMIKQIQAYQDMLNILIDGYKIVHGIRDILTGNPIRYEIVYSYGRGADKKTYAHNLTFEELMKYTTPTLLGRASHAENALFTLQLRLKEEIKSLEDNRENLEQDLLYRAVMSFESHPPKKSHNLPAPNANESTHFAKSRLLEVYYHLKYLDTPPSSVYDKLIHHFYDESLTNLPHVKGGDVLDLQIKSSKSFDLTRVTTVRKTIQGLKDLFLKAMNISAEELQKSLESIFIQDRPAIEDQTDAYINKATAEMNKMIDKEISGIERLTVKLKI